jgi:hypothetical protein
MPDFPDRNIDGATGLFSSQISNIGAEYIDFDPLGWWSQGIDGIQEAWSKTVDLITGDEEEPTLTLPELEPEDEDDDCEKLVIAVRQLTHQVARQNSILKVALPAIGGAVGGVSASINRNTQAIVERFPHRDFTKAAIIDFQHHIRDGFDAVAQTIALATEARTGKKIPAVDLPELRHTDPKLDRALDSKHKAVLWEETKQPPKPKEGGGNGRP